MPWLITNPAIGCHLDFRRQNQSPAVEDNTPSPAACRRRASRSWRASRVDSIPKWRTYLSIVIPMLRPVFVTALVIVAAGIVRTYDLVVAMTGGGPGLSSQFPTIYVYEYMFVSNLSQGLAASTVMLITVAVIVVPWAFFEFGRRRRT